MKEIILIATLFVCSFSAMSQRFAVHGGITNTTVNDKEYGDFKSRTGFSIMFLMEIPTSEHWSFNMGMGYTLRGFDSKDVPTDAYDAKKDRYLYNLKYIEWPLFMSYRFDIVENSFSIVPHAGCYAGGNISADDYTESFDFGLQGGVSLELQRRLQVGMQYNSGFLNILKKTEFENTELENTKLGKAVWKNRGWEYYVRFFF